MTTSPAQSPEGPESSSAATQAIEVIGDATPEQVAALVAVLSTASGGPVEAAPARHPSPWAAPSGLLRRPVATGSRTSGAWQRSLR